MKKGDELSERTKTRQQEFSELKLVDIEWHVNKLRRVIQKSKWAGNFFKTDPVDLLFEKR